MRILRQLLVRFGLWVARLGGWRSDIRADVIDFARHCIAEQQARWPERDGEAKRAVVYRQLTNAFPSEPKRVLSRAIEEALCFER